MKQVKLYLGDNIESLKKLPENSIDSVVSDPPYGISFMNRRWDHQVPSVEFWQEVYRVLKPGGHVLSFGGTRTYHRMTVNIEDAGFEIRDQIMWIYGSGFPKSHNIGKAYEALQKTGRSNPKALRQTRMGDEYKPTGQIDYKKGRMFSSDIEKDDNIIKVNNEYEGWGTALKPANEPICVARKPLSEKTIVENVIRWGVGGINIDGCRIGTELISSGKSKVIGGGQLVGENTRMDIEETFSEGRFPANIIFDEEAAAMLDEQSGPTSQGHWPKGSTKGFGEFGGGETSYEGVGPKDKNKDKSGASRFFYVPKVGKKERNMGLDGFEDKVRHLNLSNVVSDSKEPVKNNHPTLKPINLMNYLCRLVTPPGGIVLDPFMGSGSTGISACLEGFRFVGMEMEQSYFEIASARIEAFEEYRKLLK